jgi:hypothetical protein
VHDFDTESGHLEAKEGGDNVEEWLSSGMLRRVALVKTDVSEELSASFIGVKRIGELGTTLAVTSNRRSLRRNTNFGFVQWDTVPFSQPNKKPACGRWLGNA